MITNPAPCAKPGLAETLADVDLGGWLPGLDAALVAVVRAAAKAHPVVDPTACDECAAIAVLGELVNYDA